MRKVSLLVFWLFLVASCWAQPIHQLVRDNRLEAVAELLEAERAKPPEQGVEPLLKRRVDGATPLLVAAFAGNVKMCDLLLSFGADIEETDMMGDTSIFRAFSEDHADLAMALLAKGADLNARNKVGETPFMMSARSSEGPVFKKVLATGKSELEAADSRGRTALHHAVEYETRENIVQLLGAGASINHPDKKGSTVLHKAVAMGDADLVILLLDAGADPSLKDSRGRDAKRIAIERQDSGILRTLNADPESRKQPSK